MKRVIYSYLLLGSCFSSVAQVITTVAGTGVAGYNGDNISATDAKLWQPVDVIMDKVGNLYFTDDVNYRVRKVSITGIINTIAGTGVSGYNGDNIPATDAQIGLNGGIAMDSSGNIYFCDEGNVRLREINMITGIISTVAGNGVGGYNGDEILATNAQINGGGGIAIDYEQNIIFADGSYIRKVDRMTGLIHKVAGNGLPFYSGDGGMATNAGLMAWGIALDNANNILFCDGDAYRVRRIDLSTGLINTMIGNGSNVFSGDGTIATAGGINYPIGITLNNHGDIFVSVNNGTDTVGSRVIMVGADNLIHTVAGNGNNGYNGDGIPATTAELKNPEGIRTDMEGNLYIADVGNQRIRKVSNPAVLLEQMPVAEICSITPNPANKEISITNAVGSKLEVYDATGKQVIWQQIVSSLQVVNINNLKSGIYTVELVNQSTGTRTGRQLVKIE